MNSSDRKETLRNEIRSKRDSFVAALPESILNMAFSAMPSPLRNLIKPDITVAAYIPTASESNPLKLLSHMHEAGCKTALPHVISKISPMRFLSWSPDEPLLPGIFGLQQPQAEAPECKPDIILVPLVAFDRNLNRLGQGAAHYDRALSQLDDAITIGIAWSVQEVDEIPSDAWDVPLDAILTEKEWITQ